MMMQLASFGGLVIVSVPTFALWHFARLAKEDIVRLDHFKKWNQTFYDNAKFLMQVEELPTELLSDIRGMASIISEPYSASSMLKVLRSKDELGAEPDSPLVAAVRENEFYKSSYKQMLSSFVMAVSFNSRKLGPEIREAFSEMLADFQDKSSMNNVVKMVIVKPATSNSLSQNLAFPQAA